ncbi:DUF6199 family natural product biosynthesis protein [Nocardiopsis changdeensis]|uniref:DUF6199 domain-containing protein n=1 Tax=Nocardiopsis changdeensis TaxID=2831969 RepID=A0A975KS57_9ACTN|nr:MULTISPECIES: DUF6199 family natural product biosynthesis protein [Nocardiopsis]QUX26520.1 hypothetical protein KGD84_33010 [Nocardiopsis changdeensis]QYX40792.1 hypothetical protein K1J57_32860 [Nocardiopsis sp. MT53]
MALILTILIVCGLVLAIYPQLAWHLKSWQYRDPEQNYPSDLWFFTQRMAGGAMVVMGVVGFVLWNPAPPAEDPTAAEPSASASPSETTPRAGDLAPTRHLLTDASTPEGRLSGYTLVGEDRIEVRAWLGHCSSGSDPLSVTVQEDEETVTVHAVYFSNTFLCGQGEEHGGETSTLVDLEAPLGDRTVVDTDGEPLLSY